MTERVRRLFGGNPRRVQAAALPWRQVGPDGVVEVLLVTSRDTGRWVLPKGWPEGDETLAEAAAREAFEEAGVKGSAGSDVGRFYYDKLRGTGIKWRCEVAIVPLEVKREAQKWPEKKKRTRKWCTPEEAASMVAERDLAEFIINFGHNPREIAA